ncbi:MAG: prepilin-type N-terminal cleavage/methylation domain-containing protein [Sphingomonadales bacterium]
MTERQIKTDAGAHPANQAGFTLIEVLVALAIVAIALAPLLQVYSRGAGNADTANLYLRASAIAESMLASAGSDMPLRPGQTNGTSASVFNWTLTVRPTDMGLDEELPMALYEVEAEVSWVTGATPRSLSLRTLRVGKREPA